MPFSQLFNETAQQFRYDNWLGSKSDHRDFLGERHTVTIKIGNAEMHNLGIGWCGNSAGVTASARQMKVQSLVLGNSHESG